ncbi:MAG TPA: hypothetical protein VD907_06160 [Verrucomicrobiae bacterium]|nr:hypothetical protein [Verrucomicrobiae bacterium]
MAKKALGAKLNTEIRNLVNIDSIQDHYYREWALSSEGAHSVSSETIGLGGYESFLLVLSPFAIRPLTKQLLSFAAIYTACYTT